MRNLEKRLALHKAFWDGAVTVSYTHLLCELLNRRGLYLCTSAGSREEADALIQNTYEWSRK